MRIINPIGRKTSTDVAAHNVINACMCSGDSFAVARTSADTCAHCGCSCGAMQNDVSNYTVAKNRFYVSNL